MMWNLGAIGLGGLRGAYAHIPIDLPAVRPDYFAVELTRQPHRKRALPHTGRPHNHQQLRLHRLPHHQELLPT